ncbi:MAG: hypothetical protein WDW38_010039 [Sanguina aurantia]
MALSPTLLACGYFVLLFKILERQLQQTPTASEPRQGRSQASITHLAITLPPSHSHRAKETPATEAADAAAALLPLAAACPQLARLAVSGKIGPSVLAGFGHLETPTHAPTAPHQPRLPPTPTPTTAFQGSHQREPSKAARTSQVDPDGAICTALNACPRLLSFVAGAQAMSSTVWDALPAGLPCLGVRAAIVSCARQGVARARAPAQAGAERGLRGRRWSLVVLLAAAPHLTSPHLRSDSAIVVALSRADARDLKRLDGRWGALDLPLAASEHYEHRMPSQFLAPHMLPLPNITEVELCDPEGRNAPAGSLAGLPRLLPSIQRLTLDNLDLYPFDADSLVACRALRRLALMTVDGFDGTAPRTLCAKSKTLREVKLCGCRGITLAEEGAIKGPGGRGGGRTGRLGAVRVLVARGDLLEEEEDFRRESFWAQSDSGDSDDDSDRRRSGIYDYWCNMPWHVVMPHTAGAGCTRMQSVC